MAVHQLQAREGVSHHQTYEMEMDWPHSGNLLLTSQGSLLSGTLKELRREAGQESHEEGPSSKNKRMLECPGNK